MYWNNKVIWSEGMLLQQQHLQQHDRYWHNLLEARCGTQLHYGWGFSKLMLDEQQLSLGRVALLACKGVMPDGTPFAMPFDSDLSLPLDIPEGRRDAQVVLALPMRQPGVPEAAGDGDESPDTGYVRYRRTDCVVFDSNAQADDSVGMEVGRLRFTLAFADDVSQGYATLGVVRIVERNADNRVVLDPTYLPPCIDYRVAPRLTSFVNELIGLLHQRGEALAARLGQPNANGAAEIADFLLLQLINRTEPLFTHLARVSGLHPERLYRELLQLAGELACFTRSGKRSAPPSLYRHDALKATFQPLINDLRHALSMVMDPHAVAIALEEGQFGLRVGRVPDASLFKGTGFVLAVKAGVPAETLWASVPSQLKIGPVERIHDLVNLQLPGIGLRVLPVAPRQLPFHAGHTYFALDSSDELWPQLAGSAGIALHVAGDFPGLEMQLWAIRQ
ncbi:type VI secretion protein [Burkholderia cepacia]|uniref:type VI secretion system baseplate subunit TssK n=1 Tax=Burkholderia cepacia TaxID=292 RepID=UPI00075B0ACD|nr:type VI secretion system baseplate subunit TssK [Burkholderia cepacia]KVA46773.1 type VI secretion protein [Burkholderia cepacia]KVA51573.1 type VI secretion protein [Burkholderia cepacia]KVA70836.1 type VI secretion protein [Burkholderia cepacia]KVA78896.1 type VI secretion protein [Burkholderia cepacia]KVA78918.1 type VI secretion protein [Burkholderia cepacia]